MKKLRLSIVFLIIILFIAINALPRDFAAKKQALLPNRIISLNTAATEMLFDLGVGNKIVGTSESSYNPPQAKDKTKVGKAYGYLNIEMIISLEPDLIFTYKADAETIKKQGIPVYILDMCDLQQVISHVKAIGKIVGKESEARKITLKMKNKLNKVKEQVSKVKSKPLVFFQSGSIFGRSRASNSLTHDLITLANGINLASGDFSSYPLLSVEYIIEKNPDIIILSEYGLSIEEIKKMPKLQNIKAVKNDRIYRSRISYTHYTPRCVDGLEQFAKWFHPQLYKQ